MKAISYTGVDRIEVVDVPKPQPGDREVLLEVGAVGICGTDLLIWSGGLGRVVPPVVLGHEFSGIVVDANGDGTFSIGDRVVVEPLLNCGECAPCLRGDYNVCVRLGLIGIDVDGASAAFVTVPAHRLHRIPDSLDLRHAALAEPSAVALHMVKRSGATASDRVLIVGGGPIGALVACVCRARGIDSIVISEPNTSRRALLAGLGFDTFDPTSHPISDLVDGLPLDGFDVSFELTGVGPALATAIEATRIQGTVLLGGLPHDAVPVAIATAVMKELVLRGTRVYRSDDVEEAIVLLVDGSIPAEALITRTVPLADSVHGAFETLRDSRDEMKILIVPGQEV